MSPLAKRYGWGIHNNAAAQIALIAVESSRYKQLLEDPQTTKVKAFRSSARRGLVGDPGSQP